MTQKNCYVYAYLDPRNNVVFYVGRGTKKRIEAHAHEARSQDGTSEKVKRINDIKETGQFPRIVYLAKDLSKSDAKTVESLILTKAELSGTVCGLKSELTNIAPGDDSGRFRPWGNADVISEFEYEIPGTSYLVTPDFYARLFQHIIKHVPEFHTCKRCEGKYIDTHPRSNGFEFCLFPKNEDLVVCEYLVRGTYTEEQFNHASQLRDLMGLTCKFTHAVIPAAE